MEKSMRMILLVIIRYNNTISTNRHTKDSQGWKDSQWRTVINMTMPVNWEQQNPTKENSQTRLSKTMNSFYQHTSVADALTESWTG